MGWMVCPFCGSGLAWNECRCNGALDAQRFGMIEARKLHGVVLEGRRSSVAGRSLGSLGRGGGSVLEQGGLGHGRTTSAARSGVLSRGKSGTEPLGKSLDEMSDEEFLEAYKPWRARYQKLYRERKG